jgi:hypothetical protein
VERERESSGGDERKRSDAGDERESTHRRREGEER